MYIEWGLVHLTDPESYEIISEEQGLADDEILRKEIFAWTVTYRETLEKSAVDFIHKKLKDTVDDRFGYFYLMPKLHKNKTPMPTRPVCSDCASTPHALGQWVDEMLQPMVKIQHTYFQNSFALKSELDKLKLPPNASCFTYNVILMYTKIDTH